MKIYLFCSFQSAEASSSGVAGEGVVAATPTSVVSNISGSGGDLSQVEGGSSLTIADLPEMEIIQLNLVKDHQGLGITIAGYVCERGKCNWKK